MPYMDRATVDRTFGAAQIVAPINFTLIGLGLTVAFALKHAYLYAAATLAVFAGIMALWWFSRQPKPSPAAPSPFTSPFASGAYWETQLAIVPLAAGGWAAYLNHSWIHFFIAGAFAVVLVGGAVVVRRAVRARA